MSRPTTAVKLLLVSLPLALSMPQVFPPYQLFNATLNVSSATGVPEPASSLDPGLDYGAVPDEPEYGPPIPIEPGIGDDTGPEIFVDPLLPVDPITDPLPTVTILPDPILSDPILSNPFPEEPIPEPPIPYVPTWGGPPEAPTAEAPTVSIQTFLSIIQPLIDLIGNLFDSLPGQSPVIEPLFPDIGSLGPLKGGSLRARQVLAYGGAHGHAKPVVNTVEPVTAPSTQAVDPAVGTLPANSVGNGLPTANIPALPLFGQLIQLVNKVAAFEASRNSQGGSLGKRDALPEASSDALAKFYASLANDQESNEDIRPFAAALMKSIDALDEDTKATFLSVLGSQPMQLELLKRDAGTRFIKRYTWEFHYFYPVLKEMRPDVAQGLQDVLDDPTVPVPDVETLNLDGLPGRLRLFVLDMYTFFDMLADSSIPMDDRLSLLSNLSDDLNVDKRDVVAKREQEPVPATYIDSPTWDADRIMYVMRVLVRGEVADQALYQQDPLSEDQFFAAFYGRDSRFQNLQFSDFPDDSPDPRKYVPIRAQWDAFVNSLPADQKSEFKNELYQMYLDALQGQGLGNGKRDVLAKRVDPYDGYLNSILNLVRDGPSWDPDRVKLFMKALGLGAAAKDSLDKDSLQQFYDAFRTLNGPDHDVSFSDFPDNTDDMRKYSPFLAQWAALLASLSPADSEELRGYVNEISQEAKVGEPQRRGLRARQMDEGPTLDNAQHLGSELDSVLGPGGSLDPMGQTWQGVDDQSSGGDAYQQQSGNGPYSDSYGDDYSSQSASDPYGGSGADSSDYPSSQSYGSDPSGSNYDDPSSQSYDSDPSGSNYDDPSSQSYDSYPSGPSNDNYDQSSSGDDQGASAQDFDSNPTAQGDTPVANANYNYNGGSYDDYTPSNANLKPAYTNDVYDLINKNTTSEPEQIADLGPFNKYDPEFIDDVVEGDYDGQWNGYDNSRV